MTKNTTTISREGERITEATHSPTASANGSQSRNTPGPWRAGLGEDDDPRHGEFELAELPHHIFGTTIYAPGDYYSDDHAEHVANAHLIAAAPDLLAALKEQRDANAAILRAYAVSATSMDDLTVELRKAGIADGFGARANAAIAKAEGRA